MTAVTIYHNPRCSKSRGALELLERRGVAHRVVAYLETPPSRADLERLLRLLPDPPAALVRRDARFQELGLGDADCASAADVVELLLRHPELMQRPVVVRGDRAVIARSSERLLELLEDAA
jgi:arsenate reductase